MEVYLSWVLGITRQTISRANNKISPSWAATHQKHGISRTHTTCIRKPPSTILRVRTSTLEPFSLTVKVVGPLRDTATLYLVRPMTRQPL